MIKLMILTGYCRGRALSALISPLRYLDLHFTVKPLDLADVYEHFQEQGEPLELRIIYSPF